jgi:hypothetical protein
MLPLRTILGVITAFAAIAIDIFPPALPGIG